MTYVLTIHGLEDDTFFTEVCTDISGIDDLADRIKNIIYYYETLRGSGFTLISAVMVDGGI